MPLDPKERYEDENEAARTDLEAKQADIWTALPVIIRKHNVDANTVEADPAIKAQKVKSDGTTEWVQIDKILDAPIHFASGGGATITVPIKDGDEGLAVFSSQSIDKWWKEGGVQEQPHFRMHDLSDGFVIPGVRSQKRKLVSVNGTTLQIRTEDGKTYVELDPTNQGQISLISPNKAMQFKGDINAVGNQTIHGNITLTGDTNITQGNTTQKGDIHLTGNTTQTGNVNLTGNETIHGNLTVIKAGTDLSDIKDINLHTDIPFPTSPTVAFQGDQVTVGNVGVNGDFSVTGNVNFGGTISGLPPDIGGGGGQPLLVETYTGIFMVGFDEAKSPLITPAVDADATTDTIIEHLEFSSQTIAGGTYDFTICAGPATSPGPPIYQFSIDYGQSTTILDNNYISAVNYVLPKTLFLPYSFANTNIWNILFQNQQADNSVLSVRAIYSQFKGDATVLPVYEDPAPYSGPLFNDVYVGPTRTLNWDDQYTEPRYAMSAIADGGTMHIDGGTYYRPFGLSHPGDGLDNHPNYGPNAAQAGIGGASRFTIGITIIGNGTFSSNPTVFNGRGGAGNGHRLTLGKAFFECRAPAYIQGIQFINCGGADGIGDGECGIYPEFFLTLGTITVYKCAFDGNENGMFSPSTTTSTGFTGFGGGDNVIIQLDSCDFGYVRQNGQTTDGLSHDFYLSCLQVHVNNCHFYGSVANCMKSRAPTLNALDCYVRCDGDRCIDFPNGGSLHVQSCILDQAYTANINYLAYANEGLANTYSDPIYNDCDLRVSRYDTRIWMGLTAGLSAKFQFTGSTAVTWYQQNWGHAFITPTRDNSLNPDPTVVVGLPVIDPGYGPYPPEPAAPGPVSWP